MEGLPVSPAWLQLEAILSYDARSCESGCVAVDDELGEGEGAFVYGEETQDVKQCERALAGEVEPLSFVQDVLQPACALLKPGAGRTFADIGCGFGAEPESASAW